MEIGGVGSDRQATPPLTASTRLVHSKSASAAIVRLVGTWAVSGILGALILATFGDCICFRNPANKKVLKPPKE